MDSEDKGRGFEIGKDQYILIDEEELEAIQIESTHTIEIEKFVPKAQIDKRYFDSPYYIACNDNVGQEAFAVIREAMRADGMVALARVVIAKRERVIALEPQGKGMLGTTLRYPYEVRGEGAYFEDLPDVKVGGEMLKLAKHIIAEKTGDFDPTAMEDHYETALVELLKKKQAGFEPAKASKPAASNKNVVNLMDALRASISQAKKPAAGAVTKRRKKGKAA